MAEKNDWLNSLRTWLVGGIARTVASASAPSMTPNVAPLPARLMGGPDIRSADPRTHRIVEDTVPTVLDLARRAFHALTASRPETWICTRPAARRSPAATWSVDGGASARLRHRVLTLPRWCC